MSALLQRVRQWRAQSGPQLRLHAPRLRARRRPVPTVLQMEAVECGAASLAMILASHGRLVSLEELRVACGVSRDGSKANNIVRAARRFGLTAKGYKVEPDAIRGLPLPLILHWNFNHFVVLEGFGRKNRVYINDPSFGPRTVTEKELDAAFTGVALAFEPGPAFEPGGHRRSLLAAVRRRLESSRSGVIYAMLVGLALVIPGLVAPTFTRVFVDDVLIKGMDDWRDLLLVAMAVTAGMLGALTWFQQFYLLRLETKLALTTSTQFFWHVLHLPAEFLAQRFPGELASRVAINDRVAQLLSGDLATMALSAVVVVFYAMLMSQYDLLLTVAVVAVVALNFFALRMVSRARTDHNQRLMQDRGKAMSAAMAGLVNVETLKAMATESDFFARWAGFYAKIVNTKQELGRLSFLLATLPVLLTAVSTAIVLGIGGSYVMDGKMSMGMLVAFQALTLAFVTPVNQLITLGETAQEVHADMARLDDVLGAQVEVAGPEDLDEAAEHHPSKLTGQLTLDRVTFGYSRLDPPLITEFSLTLAPGSRVALVGGSGSGKSTVARIVGGLYASWQGAVLFDALPRQAIPRRVMTASLAVVDQEIFLFEGTIRENLTMWDETALEADVVAAARDACIDDDITARPGGYLSRVEEGGRNFSGGQRQRLEIARALVSNPSIVVLDEATSALDSATEQQIDDNLRRRGCTCLIVAHRLSTIRDCDEIIVLSHGKVVQRGTHEELNAAPGTYRDLIAMA